MSCNFEDHYQKVIQSTQEDLQKRRKMRFDRVTAPKAKVNKEYLKGRYIFDQTDVMQLPILHLNEQTVKEAYGKDKLVK